MDNEQTITVPLQMIDLQEEGCHPILDVRVFGGSFKLVLDTGASRSAFDRSILNQINSGILLSASDRLSTGLGTNSMESFTTTVNDLHFGEHVLPETEIAVLDLSAINIAYSQLGHPQVLGVLGGEILLRYKAVIDYGNATLTLRLP